MRIRARTHINLSVYVYIYICIYIYVYIWVPICRASAKCSMYVVLRDVVSQSSGSTLHGSFEAAMQHEWHPMRGILLFAGSWTYSCRQRTGQSSCQHDLVKISSELRGGAIGKFKLSHDVMQLTACLCQAP